MDTTALARSTTALAQGRATRTGGGRQPTGGVAHRTESELSREVAALTAEIKAQAAEMAALRQEMAQLRSSFGREVRTQKIVLVDERQSTTIKPGSIWLRHECLDVADDGSPRPGSGLGLAALDTWTGIVCSIEATGLPQVSADLVATVEYEPFAGVVCHLDDATHDFGVGDGDTQ